MPRDAEELRTDQLQRPTQAYIKKPVASSRGRGISVVPNISALKLSSLQDVLLQRYIDPPYLVNGLKFDLRVYVAVTSLEPLRLQNARPLRMSAGHLCTTPRCDCSPRKLHFI